MKIQKNKNDSIENEKNSFMSYKKIIFIGSKSSEKYLLIKKLLLYLNLDHKEEDSRTNFLSK